MISYLVYLQHYIFVIYRIIDKFAKTGLTQLNATVNYTSVKYDTFPILSSNV